MESKFFYVLFMDPFSTRHTQFRVRAGEDKRIVVQRHAHNETDFMRAYNEQKQWDVIFLPTYWLQSCDKKAEEEAAARVVQRILITPVEDRPRLIIFEGFKDDYHMLPPLMEAGIACAHVPWNIGNPAHHIRERI